MKRKISRTTKKESNLKNFAKKYLYSSEALPFVLTFTFLGVLFVLVRMKGIEQDYKYNEINASIREAKAENKELKAERARILSINNLKMFAKKFNLSEPSEKQIVVIPE